MKYLVGIDEAGRGPLAGPVAVGLVVIKADFDWGLLSGVNDSKQLTETARETIYEQTIKLRTEGLLNYSVHQVSAQIIDSKGIVYALNSAISRGLQRLEVDPELTEVRLDGALKAPAQFVNQQTIIKGDVTEPVISLASIMAKVTRDRYMKNLAKKPELAIYELNQHKGYGTKRHRELIKEHGLSLIHRKSFCRGLIQ